MLESALDSLINNKLYGQTNLFQLAGILAERVILNPPYQDGNKRTALFAADMFLKINGYQLQKKPMADDDLELNEGLTNAYVLVACNQWTAEDLGHYDAGVAKRLETFEQEDRQLQEGRRKVLAEPIEEQQRYRGSFSNGWGARR